MIGNSFTIHLGAHSSSHVLGKPQIKHKNKLVMGRLLTIERRVPNHGCLAIGFSLDQKRIHTSTIYFGSVPTVPTWQHVHPNPKSCLSQLPTLAASSSHPEKTLSGMHCFFFLRSAYLKAHAPVTNSKSSI